MIPVVSAGSNHVGASETCTAHVSWPSGEAGAAARTSSVSSSVRNNATGRRRVRGEIGRSRVRPVMESLLCVANGPGAKPRGTTNGNRSEVRLSAGQRAVNGGSRSPPDLLLQLLDALGDDSHELIDLVG